MIIPPALNFGDTIGLICPAGFMPFERMETCIETLENWGFKVKLGKTLHNRHHYFSGTDEERMEDLQVMIDDEKVKAILCARGGYGISRIIDRLDYRALQNSPKWIIGYSDITLLQLHLYTKYSIASLHAPMAAAFNDRGFENKYVISLKNALLGNAYEYRIPTKVINKTGRGEGRLIGGNLALFTHTIGTCSAPDTKDCILFLEDVGEYLYSIDRMMVQLKRAGKLDHLSAIIFGGFTDLKDTTNPFGVDIYHILLEKVKEYDYPVCFDFPVGHSDFNFALKIGLNHSIEILDETVNLKLLA